MNKTHTIMAKNTNLHNAKSAKNDEFYTMLTDIEKEMKYYRNQFKDKVVYCNCDDARESNFFKYFSMNFEFLSLKKLITTGFKADGHGVALIYEGDKNGNYMVDEDEIKVVELEGNGDFRSEECIDFLKEADIVVTNPPFSLFREYVAQLMEYEKKFIIIGNGNAVACKEIFPLIKENKIWMGASKGIGGKFTFIVPETYDGKFVSEVDGVRVGQVNNACWFTNMEHNKRHTPLDLYKKYSSESYPKYDNYDAIESRTDEIPMDYDGVIGVPITFLDKYCPEQFEILGCTQRSCHDAVPDTKKYNDYFEISHKTGKPMTQKPNGGKTNENPVLKGKSEGKNYFINADGDCVYSLYSRIFIKRK